MATTDRKPTIHALFSPGDFNDVSPIFSFEKQVTIRAVGLIEGDEITFDILRIAGGSFPKVCDCLMAPGQLPQIEGSQQLMCGSCSDDGIPKPVRITKDNPVVVLDAPQNSFLVAVFRGDGIGTASVSAAFNTTTDVSGLDSAMRGCPTCEPPPEPEPVYYATVKIPGGWAYRDGMQDPNATVEIKDCDDNLVGWIYPQPQDGAEVEVTDCYGNVLGYAVGYNVSGSDNTPVVNNKTEVNIPDTVTIAGMPGVTVTSMPTVKLEVPRLAVSTLETHGDIWVLYNDGSLEKSSVRYPQDAEIEKTVLISFGGVAEDMVVRAGERFALPDVAGVTGWRLGEVIYSPGYTISRRYSTVFEAVY